MAEWNNQPSDRDAYSKAPPPTQDPPQQNWQQPQQQQNWQQPPQQQNWQQQPPHQQTFQEMPKKDVENMVVRFVVLICCFPFSLCCIPCLFPDVCGGKK